ncbi:MAG: hypothetical protein V1754_14190 [Pseudomonadota bacterium]
MRSAVKSGPFVFLLLLTPLCSCSNPLENSGKIDNFFDNHVDTLYSPTSRNSIHVQHFELKSRLETKAADGFAQLGSQQRAELNKLKSLWDPSFHVYTTTERMLVILSKQHPAGPLELLFSDDLNILVVSTPNKHSHVLHRERLPDILDCSMQSSRYGFGLTLDHPTPNPDEFIPHIKTVVTKITVPFHYRVVKDATIGYPIRLQLRMLTQAQPQNSPSSRHLLNIALPLLQNNNGMQLLESLGEENNIPKLWSLLVENRSYPNDASPNMVTRVVRQTRERMPEERFSTKRNGHKIVENFPHCKRTARQVLQPEKLINLRKSKVKGPLHIENKSGFAAHIYVDGIHIGWANPNTKINFLGLPQGYYRIYATTPTGLRSWGPHDIYVPGPLTLR